MSTSPLTLAPSSETGIQMDFSTVILSCYLQNAGEKLFLPVFDKRRETKFFSLVLKRADIPQFFESRMGNVLIRCAEVYKNVNVTPHHSGTWPFSAQRALPGRPRAVERSIIYRKKISGAGSYFPNSPF